MPNPYHNADGRFCSKGEMRAAYENLAKAGKTFEAVALREEYTAITEKRKLSKRLVEKFQKPAAQWGSFDVPAGFDDLLKNAGIRAVQKDADTLTDDISVTFHAGYNRAEDEYFRGKIHNKASGDYAVDDFSDIADKTIAKMSFHRKVTPEIIQKFRELHHYEWNNGISEFTFDNS